MMARILINGEWRETASSLEVRNPARFREVVGVTAMASANDVEAALQSAHDCQPPWAETTPTERARLLGEAATELRAHVAVLANLLTRENGKPLAEAERDIRRSIELMDVISTDLDAWTTPREIEPTQPVWLRRRPCGVTAIIAPWNSPVLLSFRRMIPALATGNVVVLKPSSLCPLTVTRCVELLASFLPAGVLNLVCGSGADVGEKLASDPRVRMVGFTGSTETGRRIMALAAPTLKKLSLELGGNDPAIVLEDADLGTSTMERMTRAILRASGQVCVAIKRIYVHRSRYKELVDKLDRSFDEINVGDGLHPETTMGPMSNRSQFELVQQLLQRSKDDGLDVRVRGRQLDPSGWPHGYFLRPAVVLGASPHHDVVRCEQFGPVIPIVPVDDQEHAIRQANDSEFGLRASVWTADRRRAEGIADRLQAGSVFYNAHGIFNDLHLEFPGLKQSGLGRESVVAGLDTYSDSFGFAG